MKSPKLVILQDAIYNHTLHACRFLYMLLISQLLFCIRAIVSTRSSKLLIGSSDINEDCRGSGFSEEQTFDAISGSISTVPVCRSERETASSATRGGSRRNISQRSTQAYSTSVTYESEEKGSSVPVNRMSTAGAISQAVVRMRGEVGDKRLIKQIDTGYFSTTRSSTRDDASLQGVCSSLILFSLDTHLPPKNLYCFIDDIEK